MDREQNILRHILEADLIAKNYDDLKKQHIEKINHLIEALDERDVYWGKLHQAKKMELDKLKEAYSMGRMNKSIKEFNETFKQQEQTQDNNFLVWDKLFAKLAWKFKPTKNGDMLIDAEAVYEELKNEFDLTFKQQ